MEYHNEIQIEVNTRGRTDSKKFSLKAARLQCWSPVGFSVLERSVMATAAFKKSTCVRPVDTWRLKLPSQTILRWSETGQASSALRLPQCVLISPAALGD